MPEMSRIWAVPSSTKLPELRFIIREPPLTGDNLGLKTWGTAFAIVKKLEEFGSRYFAHLLHCEDDEPEVSVTISEPPTVKVLELGAGTGLLGIAAGAILRTGVLLTDLLEIQENMLFNIKQNTDVVRAMGGNIQGEVLDWKNPNSLDHFTSTDFEVRSFCRPGSMTNHRIRLSLLLTPSTTMSILNLWYKTSRDTSNPKNPVEHSLQFPYEIDIRAYWPRNSRSSC